MLHAAPAFLAKASYSALLTSATQELSPAKIRQSIAELVGQNRLAEADTLSNEALQRFPQSEDIVVIRALVTQVRQRVLRCMGDDARAMTVAAQGLATHPKDEQLQQEFNALQHVGVRPALKVA